MTYLNIYIYIYVYTHVSMYVCMYVYIYICMCVHVKRDTSIPSGRSLSPAVLTLKHAAMILWQLMWRSQPPMVGINVRNTGDDEQISLNWTCHERESRLEANCDARGLSKQLHGQTVLYDTWYACFIHVHMHVCMYVSMYLCMYVFCTYACMHACMHARMYVIVQMLSSNLM